jgi:hypothetical protein
MRQAGPVRLHDVYDQSFETKFAELINRLDPPNAP